ncbi:MAG TPA: hypothetical protein PKH54_04320 [Myxococcota bacterium]|nr:hypothetical protein [Myxococcota bacterium]
MKMMKNVVSGAVVPLLMLWGLGCGQGGVASDTGDIGQDAIQADTTADSSTPGDAVLDVRADALPDGVVPDSSKVDTGTDVTANDVVDDDGTPVDDIPDTSECPEPLALACGDSFDHDTGVQGRANIWGGYSCTARALSGRETVYLLKTDEHVNVTVTLTNLSVDLDVARLSKCDPFSCRNIASTPLDIQDDEQIQFESGIGHQQYIVVDGYAGATGTYTIGVTCEPVPEPECPPHLSRLVECPFIWGEPGNGAVACPSTAECLGVPCAQDGFCALYAEEGGGDKCVMGNCVYCWQDSQCPQGDVCRAGRCVGKTPAECPEVPDCAAAGCLEMMLSDTNCPTCVCDTEFFNQCEIDDDCMPISHHLFRRCVYGRCAECRFDDDCDSGECLPPGICYSMTKHPSAIFGTWLIGWYGGLDHFSYFRFEPDGTLRRAGYVPESTFADDILTGGCAAEAGQSLPGIVGTWEPEVTESGFLVVRLAFVSPCQAGTKVSERFAITMGTDGDSMTLKSVENPDAGDLTGLRINPLLCSADFTTCPSPVYPLL